MKPSKRPRLLWLILSGTLVLAITLPAGLAVMPHVYRWRAMARLDDPRPEQRHRTLRYIQRRAGADARVLAAAVERLGPADDRLFVELLAALDAAGKWRRPTIPEQSWIRWLGLLVREKDPATRVLAAQQIGDARDLRVNPQIADLLAHLLADPEPDVRYNALIAAAELAGLEDRASPTDPPGSVRWRSALLALVGHATADPEPAVARQAWLLWGLLGGGRRSTTAGEATTVEVAAAKMWAEAGGEEGRQLVARVLVDERADPDARAVAAGLLNHLPEPPAAELLNRLVALDGAKRSDPRVRLRMWRAVVSMPGANGWPGRLSQAATSAMGRWLEGAGPAAFEALHENPDLLAVLWRQAGDAGIVTPLVIGEHENPLAALAQVEGSARDRRIVLPTGAAEAIRLAAAWQGGLDSDQWPSLLSSPDPAVRDAACVAAVACLTPAGVENLVRTSVRLPDVHARQSAAVLAGLSGQGRAAAARAADLEPTWAARQIMRAALAVDDPSPAVGQRLEDLLSRDDLPRTTLVLLLLHRRDPAGLDYLLNPRGEPSSDLLTLLDARRWWRVLDTYLADDAPDFWVWADADWQRLQLDVLRNWYLLARHREGGPWPRSESGPSGPTTAQGR